MSESNRCGAICRIPNIHVVANHGRFCGLLIKHYSFFFFFITKPAFSVCLFVRDFFFRFLNAIIPFGKTNQTLSFADYTKFYVSYLLWKIPYFVVVQFLVVDKQAKHNLQAICLSAFEFHWHKKSQLANKKKLYHIQFVRDCKCERDNKFVNCIY